tara:strand:+ start:401 stop:694 length:294 start_codon:yes stop_codon:yes gene_type:complete
MRKNIYNIIKNPVVTEKTTKIAENNQFVFKVDISSSKESIKMAVEKIFKVKVKNINTIKIKGKTKVFKGTKGKRADYKKAIVSLKEGETLDYSGGIS